MRGCEQTDTLQQLLVKHVVDPGLKDFATSSDFTITTTERGVLRWEQAHLIAALDVLNAYQRSRRARSRCQVGGLRLTKARSYKNDPRTRIVELLKRWLRLHAGSASVEENEVRGICGLCRDILNHPNLFPARNPRSFLQSVAEVYEHLQLQLKEVLERDRTCAELVQRVTSLSRNLISDTIAYLMLAPTDLRQTDALPSLEVVALWQSLPDAGHPLPGRADPTLQKAMREAWSTSCGSLVAAAIANSWCIRLFNGARAEEEASRAVEDRARGSIEDASAHSFAATPSSRLSGISTPSSRLSGISPSMASIASMRSVAGGGGRITSWAASKFGVVGEDALAEAGDAFGLDSGAAPVGAADVRALAASVLAEFKKGNFRTSGLAGAFRDARDPEQARVRQCYVESAQLVFDLVYLLSEVLMQFHRVSDGLGDYGMIRMSPWLHPILDLLAEKVQKLKSNLELLGESVDKAYVLARARGLKVEKPAPTERMCSRGRMCIERAATGRTSHAQGLLQVIEDLRARSAPERLPAVAGSLGDACNALQAVFGSAEFRASVGASFPELPPLGAAAVVVATVVGGGAGGDGAGAASGAGERPRLSIAELAALEDSDEDEQDDEDVDSLCSGGYSRSGAGASTTTPSSCSNSSRFGAGSEASRLTPVSVCTRTPSVGDCDQGAADCGLSARSLESSSSSWRTSSMPAVRGQRRLTTSPAALSRFSPGKREDRSPASLFRRPQPDAPVHSAAMASGARPGGVAVSSTSRLREAAQPSALPAPLASRAPAPGGGAAAEVSGLRGAAGGLASSRAARAEAPSPASSSSAWRPSSVPAPAAGRPRYFTEQPPQRRRFRDLSPASILRRPSAAGAVLTPAPRTGGVEVFFVTPSRIGLGLRRRDRRSLFVEGGRLHVCCPGSNTQVEAVADLEHDIEACAVEPPAYVTLAVRRRLPNEDFALELDEYMFEFDSVQAARKFFGQISVASSDRR